MAPKRLNLYNDATLFINKSMMIDPPQQSAVSRETADSSQREAASEPIATLLVESV